MKYSVLHSASGRLRLHIEQRRMSFREADLLEYGLGSRDGVDRVKAYERTGDVVIFYSGDVANVLAAVNSFSYTDEKILALTPEHSGREITRKYQEQLVMTVFRRIVKRLFFPAPIRAVLTVIRSIRFLWKGIRALMHGKLDVSVLDATAIAVSILRGDFETAGSVMFLLTIGDILDEWTRKKSLDDLAKTMSLNVEQVWVRDENGTDASHLVSVRDVKPGDEVIVRTSNVIPLDGKVIEGKAEVNQASMTGEAMPVPKEPGGYVYAGTVVEHGECVIRVEKGMGSGRYDRIVKMIEDSEKLKSSAEDKYSHLADRLVPYTLLGTLLVLGLTRSPARAMAVLMVDFSCALKLSTPVSVLSAMGEAQGYGLTVKGGRFMESIAEADTIVLDKTGTITYAAPAVRKIVVFNGFEENEMLRLAACLEEHYPHSIANAVVEEARRRNLHHEERHSKVEYIVAHGVSSRVDGQKVVIGSRHFVLEDEGCVIPEDGQEKFNQLPPEYSHLYLAVEGVLAAVICVEDPIRSEAPDAIAQLRKAGFDRVVMMTGDNRHTAEAVAAKAGIDEFYAEVLPEDKAGFIRRERKVGHKVVMVGDGINDSPALSEADVGIAISDGAAIAREIADVTIAADDLYALVTLRQLSTRLMHRIHRDFRFIMGYNLGLIILGVAQVLPASTSALLHNLSTIAIGIKDTTPLLKSGAAPSGGQGVAEPETAEAS